MMAKLGITYDFILSDDENGTIFSFQHPYNDSQKEKINEILDRIYEDFINKASKGRNMSPEQLENVAKGRIWAGREAKQHGLIDEFGGLLKGKPK